MPSYDLTDQGEQAVLPGAARASDRDLAVLRMRDRLRASKAQKGVDGLALFGDAHKQKELF